MPCLVSSALYSVINVFPLCHFCWCELSLDQDAPGASNKLGWIILSQKHLRTVGITSQQGPAESTFYVPAGSQSSTESLIWPGTLYGSRGVEGRGQDSAAHWDASSSTNPPAVFNPKAPPCNPPPSRLTHLSRCTFICWWYHVKADYTWLKMNILPTAWTRSWWFNVIWQVASRGLHGLKTEARTRPVPEIVWPNPTRPERHG